MRFPLADSLGIALENMQDMTSLKSIAVVVPFLNEQENIPEMYRRLDALFKSMSERGQFLFVDDGSTDPGPAR